ncbi:MAG: peptidoglycan -binding protein [Alphaproteobacteria bacterium]|jgi:chemotaxis protein MotB|nr:peptidoglycan -binding protein [Alphaproteobacteria bacterium]MBT5859915.1 peptidoglycan -binding protein [Alphaproteobacteria bacterium]
MARARAPRSDHTWPGFVDALATLLLVIMFLLVVFMLAHFFLTQAISGRDEALLRLNSQVDELSQLLAMERRETEEMRISVTQLSASLQTSNLERDQLALRLREITTRAEDAEAALVAANQVVEADRETITARLAEIERLRRDVDALQAVRDDLELEVGGLALLIETADEEVDRLNAGLADAEAERAAREEALRVALLDLTSVRDRSAELEAQLADEAERTLLAQTELADREVRLSELQDLYNLTTDDLDLATQGLVVAEADLELERNLSVEAQSQVAILNQQILAMRQQLAQIQAALNAADERDVDQQVVIQNLGARLNVALAQRVEELSTYRSEFFGRLVELLGNRTDIRVVGDRFVFQSEVLFTVGQVELGDVGKIELTTLADALLEIAANIPEEINWVLRVDGHTDSQPINTPLFPSNWELSTARAISVVKFLIEQGVPPDRLAATGFGEFQPIDEALNEVAYRRNRRIEMKLTER